MYNHIFHTSGKIGCQHSFFSSGWMSAWTFSSLSPGELDFSFCVPFTCCMGTIIVSLNYFQFRKMILLVNLGKNLYCLRYHTRYFPVYMEPCLQLQEKKALHRSGSSLYNPCLVRPPATIHIAVWFQLPLSSVQQICIGTSMQRLIQMTSPHVMLPCFFYLLHVIFLPSH